MFGEQRPGLGLGVEPVVACRGLNVRVLAAAAVSAGSVGVATRNVASGVSAVMAIEKSIHRERRTMQTIIERDEVRRLVAEEGGQLVEVLPNREYEDEHLQGAINFPLKQLNKETAQRLDRDRPVITYCHDYL